VFIIVIKTHCKGKVFFFTPSRIYTKYFTLPVKFKIRKEKIERTRVIFKQMYKGLPVQGKNIKVDVTKDGEIVRIKSRYIPHSDLNIVPKIISENAAAIVMSDLGIKELVQVKRTIEDGRCKKETAPVMPELIVLLQERKAHLAWKFYFIQEETWRMTLIRMIGSGLLEILMIDPVWKKIILIRRSFHTNYGGFMSI